MLKQFVAGHQQRIAAWYMKNESGQSTERGELRRLLDDSHPGDALLVGSVDRLSIPVKWHRVSAAPSMASDQCPEPGVSCSLPYQLDIVSDVGSVPGESS